MMILGIDPGTTQSAWLIYDDEKKTIINFGIDENWLLFKRFFEQEIEKFIDVMVIEMIQSYGMAVGQTVFETCKWIGKIEMFFENLNVPVAEIFRSKVKMHLCNDMKAKDTNIRCALLDKMGPQGTKKAPGPTYGISKDVWSALAIVITASEIGIVNKAKK